MADNVVPPRVGDLTMLRSMSALLRAGQPLDPHEVERALEAGFGILIGLEAELSRVQRAGAAAGAAGAGAGAGCVAGAAGAGAGAAGAGCVAGAGSYASTSAELKAQIDELREALTDLRTLAVPPGESRVGYGFVLPGQPPQLHAHPN